MIKQYLAQFFQSRCVTDKLFGLGFNFCTSSIIDGETINFYIISIKPPQSLFLDRFRINFLIFLCACVTTRYKRSSSSKKMRKYELVTNKQSLRLCDHDEPLLVYHKTFQPKTSFSFIYFTIFIRPVGIGVFLFLAS